MKAVLTTAGAVVALIVSVGGVWEGLDRKMDEAHKELVPLSEYEDFQWAYLKKELRQLERDVEKGRADEEDYEELLDMFCRKYPDDRECEDE